jgi:hypothetical protein
MGTPEFSFVLPEEAIDLVVEEILALMDEA